MATNSTENNVVAEGTAAAATLKTHMIADVIKKMQGMSHDDVTKLWDQFATVDKNDNATVDNSAKNKASIAMKPSDASPSTQALKEDIALIFGEDAKELSEEFLEKATTLFEAALNLKVAETRESIFQEAAEILDEELEDKLSELTENLDEYLSYAVNEWVSENELAIESGIKFNMYESFYNGMKDLFLEHNVEIPEEAENIVESLQQEIEELQNALNEQVDKNIENQKIIDEARAEQVFDEVSEGLAATQVEKLKTLSEGIEINDLDSYRKKLTTIKEAHFKQDVKSTDIVSEDVERNEAPAPKPTGVMSHYADAISKQLKY